VDFLIVILVVVLLVGLPVCLLAIREVRQWSDPLEDLEYRR